MSKAIVRRTTASGLRPRSLQHPDVTLADALAAASSLVQRLRSLSNSVGSFAPQFYTRIRAKSIESIHDKITKNQYMYNNESKPTFNFADLDDIVGFRIVTLYDDELIPALDYIVSLVEAGHQPVQPMFPDRDVWSSLRQGKFFLRRDDPNDRYRKCFDHVSGLIQKSKISKQLKIKYGQRLKVISYLSENQYSSAHLTFNALSYPVKRLAEAESSSGYVVQPPLIIPIEFQIRAAHEDIWAEINHKFNYKIKSPYAWSAEFEQEMVHVERDSARLKALIDQIPGAIDDLVQSSKHAKDKISKFGSPDTDHYFSLGSSFFWCVSSEDSYVFGPAFTRYQALNDKLREAEALRNTASTQNLLSEETSECGRIVQYLIDQADTIRELIFAESAQLAKIAQVVQVKTSDISVKEILLNQRLLLCDFDILRLRAILLLEYGRYITDEGEIDFADEEDARLVATFLYGMFCAFKDNPDLKIRPLSVIMYWKYRLAEAFDPITARLNLIDAHRELTADISLPKWSVYRVRIPRDFAAALLQEVVVTVEALNRGGLNPSSMSGMGSELKQKLVSSLRYALESFEVYSEESQHHMGDFIYGSPEKGEAIKDAEQVVAIYLFYVRTFKQMVTVNHGVNPRRIKDVIDYLEDLTKINSGILDKAFPSDDQRRDFKNNIAEAEYNIREELKCFIA